MGGTCPYKKCPVCQKNIKNMTDKQKWLHIDRCLGQ